MAVKDFLWFLQTMESGSIDLHCVSFFFRQPTSGCHQETENSMNLNISATDLLQFSKILNVLAVHSALRQMEFHQVQWHLEQAKDLRRVSLRRNKSVKEIMLSESDIGPDGAGLMASVLKENDCLEELQIWEDSIGSKGAEELSKMIEVNSTLKLLIIFDYKLITATPLISAVLGRNRSMEVHIWSMDGMKKSSKIVEFVSENSTLRIYHLDMTGACRVTCALGWNWTVRSLDMSGVKLNSRWAKEFRCVLEQNRSLKEVNLSKTGLKNKGVIYVAAGLFKNQSLERLYLEENCFGGIGVEHLLCPLSKFSTIQNQANMTLKSVKFGGVKTKIGRVGLAAILWMLTTNQSVTHLGICNDETLKAADIVRIFKSLQKNATLKCISLQGCKGVKGDRVLETILETLKVNPWIEEIDLTSTPLQAAGKTDDISQRLSCIERIELDSDLFKDAPMTAPKSCRVFLCGQENSGKSTLCNSLIQNLSSSKLTYWDQVKTFVNPVEQAVRIPGMKFKAYKDADIKMLIWNLAGQHESYALHDLMFPGHSTASFFLIITSLFRKPSNKEPKSPSEIEGDILYWLQFIVSNSRRAVQQCMLPCVTVVLTHFDKVSQQSCNIETTTNLIQGLRDKFHGIIDFYQTVFTVDARSSASTSKLNYHLQKTSKTILEKVPRVYKLCNDLVEFLADWRLQNSNKPTMKWKDFGDICLHQIGELIYFDKLEFLILDCEWLCCEVLSQLLRLVPRKQKSTENHEFICGKDFEKILTRSLQSNIPGIGSKVLDNLEASDLVKLMQKFELCFEQNPSDSNSPLLILSDLEDRRGKPQKWPVNNLDHKYVGRRLLCDNSSHVFLTPGIFPRLQVHLHNKIMEMMNQHGASYTIDKYLIAININGIYVRIESEEPLGYCIDVLACSTKSPTEMLRLLQQFIIPAIHSLCYDITLIECVIRSECVKNITPHKNRRSQFVPLQQIKQAVLSLPAESIYDYQHTWDSVMDSGSSVLGSGFDFVRDLVSDEEFRDVLHSRYHDLYNLAMELQSPQESNYISPQTASEEIISCVDPTFSGIAKGVEAVLQRLTLIEQEIRDIKKEVQGLKYYEQMLLLELHQKVNYLVNYNIKLEERKVPNMFYFVKTENYSRRLITTLVSGMNALRMHMLCEYRREMHVVEDQIGCEIMQVDNIAVKSLAPYTTKFMKLLTFALRIGAHLAAGMGPMIPDLGKEVAHLISSPMMYGAAGVVAAGAVGAAAVGAAAIGSRGSDTRDIQQDRNVAQQWLVDFLRDNECSSGKDIAEKFGLWRVRYRDDGQIAWICRRHMNTRRNEIIEVPI